MNVACSPRIGKTLIWRAINVEPDARLGQGLFPKLDFWMKAFEQQKKYRGEHKYERKELETAATTGEYEKGCDERR